MRALAALALLLGAAACGAPNYAVRSEGALPAGEDAAVERGVIVFEGAHGVQLFSQWWRPRGAEPKGVLVMVHGLKDHSGRYDGFARRAVAAGYAVYAMDLRGHGRSAGRRVTVGSFDDYLDDLDVFMTKVRGREEGRPVFLFGHSMGGAIVTLWSETRQPPLAGLILSGPALQLDVWPVTVALSVWAGGTFPNAKALKLPNGDFSSDPAVVRAMGKDPLIYQPAGPAHTAGELVAAIARIWAGLDTLTMPLLVLHGTADRLTAPQGSLDLVERAPANDKTLKVYSGLWHDLLHEPDGKGDAVAGDIIAWMDARLEVGAEVAGGGIEYAGPLTGGTRKPSVSHGFGLGYLNAAGMSGNDDQYFGTLWVRTRVLTGSGLGFVLGVDAEGGFGRDAAAYAVHIYPVGLAAHGRWLVLGLAGGVGVSAFGDLMPFAFDLPIELFGELQLGPFRTIGWLRPIFQPGVNAPPDREPKIPFLTEFDVGASLSWQPQRRYWRDLRAGQGPSIGVSMRSRQTANVFGVSLGWGFWGGGG